MNIFNSLGSNYNLAFILRALFSSNSPLSHTKLEQSLRDKYGGKAILLYKGREAIELILKSLNLPKDSYVAINGFTCFAVFEAIKNTGLNCAYLDIDRGGLNFSANTLEKAVEKNPKIKVVIVQNTLGYPSDIEGISKVCKQNNIYLVEDLAHCIGTRYEDGKEAGTVGDLAVLSFSQDKMIDGISGGALIGKNAFTQQLSSISFRQQLIDKLYPFFTFLIRKTYPLGIGGILHFSLKNLKLLSNPMTGGEGMHKLPVWYCKLVEVQFNKLADNLNHRKTIASIYAKLINPKILSPNIVRNIHLSSNLRFPIFVSNRKDLIKHLADNQIFVSDIWYDAPIAPKKYLSQTDYQNQCPNAELASEEIVNLPTHINVSEKDAEKISQLINQWLKLQ